MMVTTHVLVGALVGGLAAVWFPVPTAPAVIVGMLGGFVPDLDKLLASRRTLHYPVLGLVAAGVVGVGVVALGTVTEPPSSVVRGGVFVAVFLVAGGLHAAMEVLGRGGGLHAGVSERAVYNHVSGRWMTATYLVPEASVRELLLGGAVLVPVALLVTGPLRLIAVLLFLFSVGYALAKERINATIPDRFETMTDFVKFVVLGRESAWTDEE